MVETLQSSLSGGFPMQDKQHLTLHHARLKSLGQISECILAKFPDYDLHLLYVRSRVQMALTGSGRVNWTRVTTQHGSTAGTWRIRTAQETHNIRHQLNKDEQD